MIFLYNLFIAAYVGVIKIASLRSSKAKAWLKGRTNVFAELEAKVKSFPSIIWVHCASAGELEQAKPIIKALKQNFISHKVLVSFFSPSGFDVGKHYEYADATCFLPADTKHNAARFIELVQPKLVLFVKYDYWYHYLSTVAAQGIPLLLVSAVFRKDQVFFNRFGGFYRKMLSFFLQIFVQDQASLALLHSYNIHNCSLAGDTRFDRVTEIAQMPTELAWLTAFAGGDALMVAGSTWPEDEQAISAAIRQRSLKLVVAPHEITAARLRQIQTTFNDSVNYSNLNHESKDSRVLILDNVGMLSRAYKYATIAYVGGGFTKDGIHNVLEAAVYGKPVVFGPNYKKYREAAALIAAGGAFAFKDEKELGEVISDLLEKKPMYTKASAASAAYTQENTGATQKIIEYIQAKRLLTS